MLRSLTPSPTLPASFTVVPPEFAFALGDLFDPPRGVVEVAWPALVPAANDTLLFFLFRGRFDGLWSALLPAPDALVVANPSGVAAWTFFPQMAPIRRRHVAVSVSASSVSSISE